MSASFRKRKPLWLPGSEADDEKVASLPHPAGSSFTDGEGPDKLDEYMLMVEREAREQASESKRAKKEDVTSKPLAQKSMAARREEGLNKPIGASNKGFRLLAMMGYKGDGPEPIAINLKTGKTGLGVEEERRRVQKAQEEQKQRQAQKARDDLEERRWIFRDVQAQQFMDRKAEQHLSAARQVCETLDRRNLGLQQSFMWPQVEEEEDSGDEPGMEDLAWAGKGPTEAECNSGAEDDAKQHRMRAWQEWQAAGSSGRLEAVLCHMRAVHQYCFFCGCDYPSPQALSEGCPGPAEEDH